jgi:hypothetical protein
MRLVSVLCWVEMIGGRMLWEAMLRSLLVTVRRRCLMALSRVVP